MATIPLTTTESGSAPTRTTTLPMTSIFTQPSACASSWTYEPFKYNNWYPGILMQNRESVVSSCFPSGFANSGRLPATIIYSPGYCPAGYTSADTTINGQVTVVTCCYSDFSYTTTAQIDSNSITASFAGCTSMLPSSFTTTVPDSEKESNSNQASTQLAGSILMWAQPILVLHQSSDSTILVSASATTTSTPIATSGFISSTSSLISSISQQLHGLLRQHPPRTRPTQKSQAVYR